MDDYLSNYNLRSKLLGKYLNPGMLSAVRGPDNWQDKDADEVKYEIVGRIRFILFDSYPGVYTSWHMERDGINNLKTAIDALPIGGDRQCFHHFLAHLKMAVFLCQDEAVWGGYGAEIYEYLEQKLRS